MTEIEMEAQIQRLAKKSRESYHDRMLRLQEEYGEFR